MIEPDEPVYYSDGIDPVRRSSSDEVFFLMIEARPEPHSDEFGQSGGAFVNCWVNADDLRTAERRAVELIHESGWRPHKFEEWRLVTKSTYEGDDPPEDGMPSSADLVDQALVDGEVCVFHTWPFDAPDDDDESGS
jgi:hypothetical protein